jgi:hypothetical protein
VAVQLSLPLPDPRPGPRRVWFLTTRPADLDALRRVLAAGPDGLVNAGDGRSVVSRADFVLIRVGDDRFEAFGCPADILDTPEPSGDLAGALQRAVRAEGHEGHDLIGFTRGRRPPAPDEPRPGTPIEDLFRLLRDERARVGHETRRRLCCRALTNLGDEQVLLRALLAAQGQRLALLSRDVTAADELPRIAPSALRGISLASFRDTSLAGSRGTDTPDLFGQPSARGAGRDLSFQAIRIQAVALPLRPTGGDRPFSRLEAGYKSVRIDEGALAGFIQPVRSHRLVGSIEWAHAAGEIDVWIDWEVRRSFPRLLASSRAAPALRVWLESADGGRATIARDARVGQNLRLAVPRDLMSPKGAAGLVVFEVEHGRRARQAFQLTRAA